MTNKQAIAILKEDLHEVLPNACVTARKHNEATDMAIKALEKQVPKKPKYIDDTGINIVAQCVCGSYSIVDFYSCRNPFCSKCGQRIDWSKEE